MAYSPRLQAILEKSRQQIRAGDVLSHDEFWADVEGSRTPGRQPQDQRGRKRNARATNRSS
ncbi:MAG TPA: hypothetical protein VML55_12675, partial [Planctomycetaceae bacterium]|nr:hypothetical protein [Planctomycetaceae bacterium]